MAETELTAWTAEPDAEAVREVLLAAKGADGRPEVEATGPLPREFAGGLHLLARVGGRPVGYAHLDTEGDSYGRQVAELVVHPEFRRRGVGTALAKELEAKAADGARVWAHGDHPGAAALANEFHLGRQRELLILHAAVEGADWPAPVVREGLKLRTFVVGQDEEAVIAVNARAFDWHPEQGAFTVDELRAEEAQSWFDPAGFFLAEDAQGEVVGFHWTKVHEPVPGRFGGEPVGEVYVVGVDPATQGGGLGKALTLAGLRYLRERGLRQVILYVEGDNAPALAVYKKLGFTRFETDVQYGR
ncbi:mycothiol synthase [Amycolatopsis sp. FDAARGOS 1241]|uniref:mycothiol synthase n=1 Tax=Amycolatopsis sp. FDAARGOS 1241 TaxID=2778070 RepID=UPI00194E2229|nr:mycothiol synthase [Amycolatopsis sp. FDAARGOS 1241]QRP46382.1 mycothiol synthase [Amycolatopsis sp. FDAARGOS 1241]